MNNEKAQRLKESRGTSAMRVRDILGCIAACREQVKAWRDSLRSTVSDDRTKLLLNYLEAHEVHIEACLAEYSRETATAMLDTWVPFGIDKALLDAMEDGLRLDPSMTAQDVANLTLEIDRALMQLYSRLASAPLLPARVRDLFGSLLTLEKHKDRRLSLALLDA